MREKGGKWQQNFQKNIIYSRQSAEYHPFQPKRKFAFSESQHIYVGKYTGWIFRWRSIIFLARGSFHEKTKIKFLPIPACPPKKNIFILTFRNKAPLIRLTTFQTMLYHTFGSQACLTKKFFWIYFEGRSWFRCLVFMLFNDSFLFWKSLFISNLMQTSTLEKLISFEQKCQRKHLGCLWITRFVRLCWKCALLHFPWVDCSLLPFSTVWECEKHKSEKKQKKHAKRGGEKCEKKTKKNAKKAQKINKYCRYFCPARLYPPPNREVHSHFADLWCFFQQPRTLLWPHTCAVRHSYGARNHGGFAKGLYYYKIITLVLSGFLEHHLFGGVIRARLKPNPGSGGGGVR